MARYTHPDALDGGLNEIRSNVNAVWLVPGYTTAMTRAQADTAKLATAAMVIGDMTLGSSGLDRTLTLASKAGTAVATAAGPHDLHLVYVDATRILHATDETSDQGITSGNPVTFPQIVVTANQPVAP